MPTHDYICDGCGDEFEHWQSFKDKDLKICNKCNNNTLRKIYTGGIAVIDKTPKTVGALADQNSKRVGKDKIIEEQVKHKEKRDAFLEKKTGYKAYKPSGKKPFYRKEDKPLDLSQIKDVNKYIRTGKKN